MINHKALEFIFIMMAQNIKDNGNKTNSTEGENKYGLIMLFIKDNISLGKKMELGISNGQMVHNILENLLKIILMVKVL